MSDWMEAESHADRAREMYERGRWADAEAELRKAISLNPGQPEWHFNLGLTLEAAGRDSDALASFLQAIELMPEEPEPLVLAGILANRLEQFDRAIAWFEQAIRLQSDLEAAYAHKIESHIRCGQHEEAETTFYLAQQALSEPSAQCLAVLAESLIQRSIFDRAEWCLKEAMRLEPNMPRLRARLAAVLAATGHQQRALQLFVRELRDDPGNIDTLLEYGSLLKDMRRWPEAAEKFRRVLEIEPANVEAHYQLGQVALLTHRFEQAHMEFELVWKLNRSFPNIRLALGEAMLRRGRIDDARQMLVEEFESLRAQFADTKDEPSQQENLSQKNGEQSPSAEIHRTQKLLGDLGRLLLQVQEPACAAAAYEMCLSFGPSADLLQQLALARFRAGDRAGGAAVSRRVLRLQPHCVRSIHNLALAALENRQLRVASGWVRRGLAIDRHNDDLRRLRMRIWMTYVMHACQAQLASANAWVMDFVQQVSKAMARKG